MINEFDIQTPWIPPCSTDSTGFLPELLSVNLQIIGCLIPNMSANSISFLNILRSINDPNHNKHCSNSTFI